MVKAVGKKVGKKVVEQPLHCALRVGWLATIKDLVEYDADTGARTGEFASPLGYFLDQRKYHLEWKYFFDQFAQMGLDFSCPSCTGQIEGIWPMTDALTDKGVEEVMRLLRPKASPQRAEVVFGCLHLLAVYICYLCGVLAGYIEECAPGKMCCLTKCTAVEAQATECDPPADSGPARPPPVPSNSIFFTSQYAPTPRARFCKIEAESCLVFLDHSLATCANPRRYLVCT